MLTTSCKKDPTNYVGSWDGKNWRGYQSGSLVVNDYDDDVSIISSDNYFANNLIIPKKVKLSDGQTKKLTRIGDDVFNFGTSSNIRSHISGRLTLPPSLERIGTDAFASNAISSLDMSNCTSLTTIDNAFMNCSSLTSLTLPNSLESIGLSAFNGCSSLASVKLPNSLTTIGSGAFAYCSSLASVILPNSLTNIGSFAFYDCSSLTSITAAYTSSPTWAGTGIFGGVNANGTVVNNDATYTSDLFCTYLKNSQNLPSGWGP